MPRAARDIVDIRSLARSHTATCIRALASIVTQVKAPPAARVMAATALLDRGWGRAAQVSQVQGDVRVIVRQIIDSAGEIAKHPIPQVIDVTPGCDDQTDV